MTAVATVPRRSVSRLVEWIPPVSARQLGYLRVFVGAYSVIAVLSEARRFIFPYQHLARGAWEPLGIFSPLSRPLPSGVVTAIVVAAVVSGISFAAGFHTRLSGFCHVAFVLAVITYRGSWGSAFSADTLPFCHLVILAAAPSADAMSLDARRGATRARPPGVAYGWAVVAMMVLSAVLYFTSGLTKVRLTGLDYGTHDTLRYIVSGYNMLLAKLGSTANTVAEPFVRSSLVPRIAGWTTLAIELLAPFAVISRVFRRVWLVAVVAFHVGILVLMRIAFPYYLIGLSIAPFVVAELAYAARLPRRTVQAAMSS